MPTNKREGIIFTTLMCFMMVFGMSTYNLFIHQSFAWDKLFIGLIPGFIVAFILDVFFVGVLAKFIAQKLPINHNSKTQMILSISIMMIIGMVTFMSLFGIVMEQGIPRNLLTEYTSAWKANVIMAFPLQLIVVGPISRIILKQIQKRQ